MTVPEASVLTVAAIACIWDLRTRRIPNSLTFGAAGVACAMDWSPEGSPVSGTPPRAGWSVSGSSFRSFCWVGWAPETSNYWRRWARGSALRRQSGSPCMPGLAGGPLAIAAALIKGKLRQSLSNLWCLIVFWRVAGIQPMPGLTLRTAQSPRLPYAVPIAAGAAVALWLR